MRGRVRKKRAPYGPNTKGVYMWNMHILSFVFREKLGGGRAHQLGVSPRPLTLILLQKYRDVNVSRIVMHIRGVKLHSARRRAYFCKSIAIEMGGAWRCFSKALGSGVDLTLLQGPSMSIPSLSAQPLTAILPTPHNLKNMTALKVTWVEDLKLVASRSSLPKHGLPKVMVKGG